MRGIAPRIGRYPPLVVARADTPIIEILKGMSGRLVRHAPIVDDEGRLVGIVSAKNIVNFLGGGPKHEVVEEKYGGDLYSALIKEPAASIMSKDVAYVSASSSLASVVDLMMSRDVGALPVVDEDERLIGIISERHVTRLFAHHPVYVKVSAIMSSPPITADPDEPILSVQKVMISKDIRRMLVTKGKRLVGIATIKDVLRFYARERTLETLKRGLVREVQLTPIAKIATMNPATISPSADISEATKVFKEKNIGSLPVVENGQLVGIVTERDILLKLPKIMGIEVFVDAATETIVMGWVYF